MHTHLLLSLPVQQEALQPQSVALLLLVPGVQLLQLGGVPAEWAVSQVCPIPFPVVCVQLVAN